MFSRPSAYELRILKLAVLIGEHTQKGGGVVIILLTVRNSNLS